MTGRCSEDCSQMEDGNRGREPETEEGKEDIWILKNQKGQNSVPTIILLKVKIEALLAIENKK